MKRKRYKTLYGILDGFGEVTKWSMDKPSDTYEYVIKRVEIPDPLEGVEDALL